MTDPVKDLFATILGVPAETLRAETTPADLEDWDSMQQMILVSGFEEEFGIEIEPEEAVEMYRDYRTFERIIKGKLP